MSFSGENLRSVGFSGLFCPTRRCKKIILYFCSASLEPLELRAVQVVFWRRRILGWEKTVTLGSSRNDVFCCKSAQYWVLAGSNLVQPSTDSPVGVWVFQSATNRGIKFHHWLEQRDPKNGCRPPKSIKKPWFCSHPGRPPGRPW